MKELVIKKSKTLDKYLGLLTEISLYDISEKKIGRAKLRFVPNMYGKDFYILMSLVVNEKNRDKKYGSYLIEHVKNFLEEEQLSCFLTDSTGENIINKKNNQRFYSRHGWINDGMHYFYPNIFSYNNQNS